MTAIITKRCQVCGIENTTNPDMCDHCLEAIDAYLALQSAFASIPDGLRVVKMMKELSLATFNDKGFVQSIGHAKTEGGQISPGMILAPLSHTGLLLPGGYIRHALEFFNRMLKHEKDLGVTKTDLMHIAILRHIHVTLEWYHYSTSDGPLFRRVKPWYPSKADNIKTFIIGKYGINCSIEALDAVYSNNLPSSRITTAAICEDHLSFIHGLSNGIMT